MYTVNYTAPQLYECLHVCAKFPIHNYKAFVLCMPLLFRCRRGVLSSISHACIFSYPGSHCIRCSCEMLLACLVSQWCNGWNNLQLQDTCVNLRELDLSDIVFSQHYLSLPVEAFQNGCPMLRVLRLDGTAVLPLKANAAETSVRETFHICV